MTDQQSADIEKFTAFINAIFNKQYETMLKIEDNSINYIFHMIDPTHETGKFQHIISKEWFDELIVAYNNVVAEMQKAA